MLVGKTRAEMTGDELDSFARARLDLEDAQKALQRAEQHFTESGALTTEGTQMITALKCQVDDCLEQMPMPRPLSYFVAKIAPG